jgi:WD40 repeat protein/tRNA A-37 threonylcarbamoyl transferase component Bud32
VTEPSLPESDALPRTLARRIDQVCNQFEHAWQNGPPPRIEDFLGDAAEPERSALLRELILLDMDYRRRRGETPRTEDYGSRFPELGAIWLVEAVMVSEQAVVDAGRTVDGDVAAVLPPDLRGRCIGDYELEEEIARGGMGVVYKARQKSLGRVVALKMILAGRLASAEEVQRFLREAENAASLDHPNIVPIYEVQSQDGLPYFSMKYVEGGHLGQSLEQFTGDPKAAARLMATVARAVHYAHQRGILHRDLKPENILLDPDGRPHVTDFGLARRVASEGNKTRTGAIVGTPSYMSPEQASGQTRGLTWATDVYALGAVLYELLTGRPPFKAATPLDTILQVIAEEAVAPRQLNPAVPRDLETICLKCLQKEPEKRHGSAEELAADLSRFQEDQPILARPVGPVERAVKWARRRPAAAGLLGTCGMTGLVLVGLLASLWDNERVRTAKDEAVQAREYAEEQEQIAQEAREQTKAAFTEAEKWHYFHRVVLAQRAWQNNEVARMERLLKDCRPEHRHWEWYYLWRLCHPCLLTVKGESEGMAAVGFSSDGKRLASVSSHRTVKVWDATTGAEVLTRPGLPFLDLGLAAAFSPDGKPLATAAPDSVTVVDTDTGREILTSQGGRVIGHNNMAFSPDSRYFAVGERDVEIWDLQKQQEVRTIESRTNVSLRSLAFSSDGKRLITGKFDSIIKVWDLDTGAEVRVLKGHTHQVTSLACSPDGKLLASSSTDAKGLGELKVWDLRTGKVICSFKGHTREVTRLLFSPDGSRLVSASVDQTIRIWDPTTGEPAGSFMGHRKGVDGLVFSPDGKRLASAAGDEVKVWDVSIGENALTLRLPKRPDQLLTPLTCVAISPDGRRVAVGNLGGSLLDGGRLPQVKVWETATGREMYPLRGDRYLMVSSLAFSPDGKRLAVGGTCKNGSDGFGEVKVWDLESGQVVAENTAPEKRDVFWLGFDPDGKRLTAAGFEDFQMCVWEADTGKELMTFKAHPEGSKVAFSPDGKRLAITTRWAQTVTVWEAATGKEVFTLKGQTYITSTAFSPDGKYLALGDAAGFLELCDAATGQQGTQRAHGFGSLSGFLPRWQAPRQCQRQLEGRGDKAG